MDDIPDEDDSLGFLVIESLTAFSSILQFDGTTTFNVPERFYVKETIFAKVYCENFVQLSAFLKGIHNGRVLVINQAQDRESADIEATFSNGKACFSLRDYERNSTAANQYRFCTADIDKMRQIVTAAARFGKHLKCCGRPIKNGEVKFDLFKLRAQSSASGIYLLDESSGVPIAITENSCSDIVVGDIDYAVILHNSTTTPLYPYLFIFNPDDLSIRK